MMASQNGHLDVVRVLLDKGAEVNAKRIDGTTALMVASQNGHREVVRELLEKGAVEGENQKVTDSKHLDQDFLAAKAQRQALLRPT